jgi:hypothetical protein
VVRIHALLRRYTLSGVRLSIPAKDTTLQIDPSFYGFVPPLGQIIEDFAPMRDEFIEYDAAHPALIAAHFDITVGKLRSLRSSPTPHRSSRASCGLRPMDP